MNTHTFCSIKQLIRIIMIGFIFISFSAYATITNLVPPSITGNTFVGSTLTGNVGQWSSSLGNQIFHDILWYRCDVGGSNCQFTGGSDQQYLLTNSDLGKVIRIDVNAYDKESDFVTLSSALTASINSILQPPVNITLPSVNSSTGLFNPGVTLIASTGTWSNNPIFNFQYHWIRCDASGSNCLFLSNANSPTFLTSIADVNFTFKVQVIATNSAGTSAPATSPASPVISSLYSFNGFLPPVYNLPDANEMKAGSSAPIKFSLGGDKGLNVITSIVSERVNCSTGTGDEIPIDTVNAGQSSLSYDPLTDQYTYVWKTEKNWKSHCRLLTMTLNDGSTHQALFRFK